MKSTKVQTLGAVALHATAACTDEASIIGLTPCTQLGCSLVSCLVLHVVGSVHVHMCTYCTSYMHAPTQDRFCTSFRDVKQRGIMKHCNMNKMVDSSWLGPR